MFFFFLPLIYQSNHWKEDIDGVWQRWRNKEKQQCAIISHFSNLSGFKNLVFHIFHWDCRNFCYILLYLTTLSCPEFRSGKHDSSRWQHTATDFNTYALKFLSSKRDIFECKCREFKFSNQFNSNQSIKFQPSF